MTTEEAVVVVAAVEVVVAAEEIVLKVIGPALPTEVAVVVENAKKVIAHRPKEVVDVETAIVIVQEVMVKSRRKVETVVAAVTDLAMTALLKEEKVAPITKAEVRTKNTATKERPVKSITPTTDSRELAVENAIKEKVATVLEEQDRTRMTIHLSLIR